MDEDLFKIELDLIDAEQDLRGLGETETELANELLKIIETLQKLQNG